MKNINKKIKTGQALAELPYVLLDVKERIWDGSFFDLSSRAQSLLYVLAANVHSTETGECVYKRELMAAQADIRLDSMGRTVDELVDAGLVKKREWRHMHEKTLKLPVKKVGMLNNTERYIYLESRIVTIFLWGSFPSYSRSVFWLLKGNAVPGCRADYPFIDDIDTYKRMVVNTRFEIVLENFIDRFGIDEKKGHEIIKKSRTNYTRGMAELKKSKIVYDYKGKYAEGLAIKKINLI